MALLPPQHASSELITAQANRDFSGAGNWSGTVWSVSGGAYVHTAGANSATLVNANFTKSVQSSGHMYKLTFTVSNIGGATPLITPYIGAAAGTSVTANGTYTQYIIAAADNANLIFTPNATMTGDLDNVSVMDTNTTFVINNAGSVGVGTVSPNGIFEVTKPSTIASQRGCYDDNFCPAASTQGSTNHFGYQFEADVDGYITKIWTNFPGSNSTNNLTIHDDQAASIAFVDFKDSQSGWRSVDITPTYIYAGRTYTISMRYSGTRTYTTTSSFPHVNNHITIIQSVGGNASNDAMPTSP